MRSLAALRSSRQALVGLFVALMGVACAQIRSDSDLSALVVRQRAAEDCGVAALATLIRANWSIDLERVLYDRVVVPDGGLSLLEIKELAARHGYTLVGVRLDDKAAESRPEAWIAQLEVGTTGHYVVVLDWGDNWLTLGDPSRGIVRTTVDNFRQRWTRRALVSEGSAQQRTPFFQSERMP